MLYLKKGLCFTSARRAVALANKAALGIWLPSLGAHRSDRDLRKVKDRPQDDGLSERLFRFHCHKVSDSLCGSISHSNILDSHGDYKRGVVMARTASVTDRTRRIAVAHFLARGSRSRFDMTCTVGIRLHERATSGLEILRVCFGLGDVSEQDPRDPSHCLVRISDQQDE